MIIRDGENIYPRRKKGTFYVIMLFFSFLVNERTFPLIGSRLSYASLAAKPLILMKPIIVHNLFEATEIDIAGKTPRFKPVHLILGRGFHSGLFLAMESNGFAWTGIDA